MLYNMLFVDYLGHGIFHRVPLSVLTVNMGYSGIELIKLGASEKNGPLLPQHVSTFASERVHYPYFSSS